MSILSECIVIVNFVFLRLFLKKNIHAIHQTHCPFKMIRKKKYECHHLNVNEHGIKFYVGMWKKGQMAKISVIRIEKETKKKLLKGA